MNSKIAAVAAGLTMLLFSGTAPAGAAEPAQENRTAAPKTRMLLFVTDPATAKTVTVPLMSDAEANRAVAVVNGDVITVDDLRNAVAELHQPDEGGAGPDAAAKKANFPELLKRIINVLLIVQEAGAIGFEETPELKQALESFSKMTMRSVLREELWKNVTVDEKEVERAYREATDEVKITLIPFAKEKDAKQAAAAIKKGKKFDDIARQAVKKHLTEVSIESGIFLKKEELHPVISGQIPTMKVGGVSPVLKIEQGGKTAYGVFRLVDKRSVESEEAREAARRKVRETAKYAIVSGFLQELYKKGVTTDVKLIESLDYSSAGPGIEKLMEDKRVAVTIEGESPVTVADISEGFLEKLYHGSKSMTEKKWVRMKQDIVEELVQKKLLLREAYKRGIDRNADYLRVYNAYRRNLLFNAFLERVVVPEIRITDDELRAYYREHAPEYRASAQVKMRSLAFENKTAAVAALEKLKKGADFAWVRTHAEGQTAKSAERELPFEEEKFVVFDALSEELRKAIEVPQPGEFRLYESPDKIGYVLDVLDVIPEKQQPFEEVSDAIRGFVFNAKLNKAVEEWAEKLKASSDVKTYLAAQ